MAMLIAVLKGIATYIPGLYHPGRGATGGTVCARYCYSVWMRHLCMAHRNGMSTDFQAVAELGPGDSLGLGLAALLSGARAYYALDIVPYTCNERNLKVLRELVALFRSREPIPSEKEFPGVRPALDSYSFPHDILTDERLERALDPERITAIGEALQKPGKQQGGPVTIAYYVPWNDGRVVQESSVDLIFSQAVLEHIDDLDGTYQAMYRWLKPDGILSHEIDFRAHHLDARWNAHWTYSDMVWKLIRGKRPYLLNRQPLSVHLGWLRRNGFNVTFTMKHQRESAVSRSMLARPFRDMSEEDLTTSGVFLQAGKGCRSPTSDGTDGAAASTAA